MREQSSTLAMRMLASAVSALALVLASPIFAGDPIQVSGDKNKQAPADARPVDPEVFKSWNKTKGPALKGLSPYIFGPGQVDPKEERRLKNARDEKKNWMLLEPGELQQRDDDEQSKFGGRSIALDRTDDDNSRNILFYSVTQQKSDKIRNPPPNAAPADSEDDPKKDTRPTLSVLGPREAEKPGAHTVNELNLKGLVDPSQVSATKFNQNDASVFQFLKDNTPAGADRDQQARRESFREFINGPQQPAPSASGLSDPINFRTDLTQERMNPTMPLRPGFDLPASKPADSFLSAPAFGGLGRAQSLPDMITTRALMGSALPSPMSPWLQNDAAKVAPKASVMPNGSLFNRDAPAFRR
jgi:hypothetical protein